MQVEIVTRPGLTAWSGNANMGLRTDVLNARNAFAKTETPEQFRRFTLGTRGPLVKNRTSIRFNVDGNRSYDTGTIFALKPDETINGLVKRPVEATNVTVGLDHGLTKNSTLRMEFRNSDTINRNQGVGDFSLLERAFTRTRNEKQLRTSVQTVLGKKLNEFRVQWNHLDSGQVSVTNAHLTGRTHLPQKLGLRFTSQKQRVCIAFLSLNQPEVLAENSTRYHTSPNGDLPPTHAHE